MTAGHGHAEWHGSASSGSGTITVGDGVREWWTLLAVW